MAAPSIGWRGVAKAVEAINVKRQIPNLKLLFQVCRLFENPGAKCLYYCQYNLQLDDVPGADFVNSLYAFGQSGKR